MKILPRLIISGLGHRNINKNEYPSLKREITDILNNYKKDFNVLVKTSFAPGADLLIAECAYNLNIDIEAILPLKRDDYLSSIKEDALKTGFSFSNEEENLFNLLLDKVISTKIIEDKENIYQNASLELINTCEKIIILWDKKEYPLFDKNNNPINLGGTYHSLYLIRKRLKEEDIHILSCTRSK